MKKLKSFKSKAKAYQRKFLKKYYELDGKYKYPLFYIANRILFFMELLILLMVVAMLIFWKLDISMPELLKDVSTEIPTISENLNRQLLFSQITLTFILLSLFSLIINLKKEKIFGTSIYKITFARSIFGNIIFVGFLIFILLFLNIYFYISDNSSVKIFPIFLSTLLVLSSLVLKVLVFTNSETLSINKVASIYYWENRKLVLCPPKAFQMKMYSIPEYLFDLKADTVEKILRNDIEYRKNLYVLDRISNLSLINYKYKIQENYTEIRGSNDTIIIWSQCIEELVGNELYSEAIKEYNKMINIFINNEVYISSFQINDLLKKILNNIASTESKIIFKQNKSELLNSMQLTMQYAYYKLNNDFTYTRMGQLRLGLPLKPLYGEFFIDYYNLIDKNLDFEELEKSKEIAEFFYDVGMMDFDLSTPFDYKIDKLKYNNIFSDSRDYDGDLCLLGIPISNLLILLMQDDKKGRFVHLLNNQQGNSVHYACLIVAAKLVTLYFQIDNRKEHKGDKEIISKYLILLLVKLTAWEDFKIKHNCHLIKEMFSGKSDYLYSSPFFNEKDSESLKIVQQTVMIKKKNVDSNSITFSDKKLQEVVQIFTDINLNVLDELQREESVTYKEKYGILSFLY